MGNQSITPYCNYGGTAILTAQRFAHLIYICMHAMCAWVTTLFFGCLLILEALVPLTVETLPGSKAQSRSRERSLHPLC
ncbi:uncharacterized protein BO72DRAFT_447269 [Aspergillus fijiensis CBS 313.89]|uniref:Uncharacterized protein n=1 Tax=Aspergillus fijiensis CBS 313.89 TaxID=1448319 RepID=A0A8G1RQ59_9EURO|nr:uncharacterized protein BO72DRAFT_447269 [Aspergillus fijiensis CBS 313.89]RAK78217.1 hypothetical protein BO72DRAFT_447269 [Aspergillus fijiensis CBS 313.89]